MDSEAAILFGKRAVNTLQSMRQDMASMESSLRQSFVRDKSDLYPPIVRFARCIGPPVRGAASACMMKEEEYFDHSPPGSSDPRTAKMELTATESAVVESSEGVSRRCQVGRGVEAPARQTRAHGGRRAAPAGVGGGSHHRAELHSILAVADIQRSFAGPECRFAPRAEIGAMGRGAACIAPHLAELGEGAVLVHYGAESRIHILLTTPAIQIARVMDVDRTLNLRITAIAGKTGKPAPQIGKRAAKRLRPCYRRLQTT